MHKYGTSYGSIAKAISNSKRLAFYTVKTGIKKKERSENDYSRGRVIYLRVKKKKKDPHKTANQIRVTVFGKNSYDPAVDTLKRRLREAGLFERGRTLYSANAFQGIA